MAVSPEALTADWLGACRRAADGLRQVLRDHPTSRERIEETGERGEGGDRTLVIDQQSEDRVFEELEKLHDGGARFQAVSEERGVVDFGSDDVTVVIDPIDGSLNAKRGLPHVGLSIAVASGPSMGDMEFGYVLDMGTEEEWVARRGAGVLFNGDPLPESPPERRTKDGKLEIVLIESSDPRWIAPHMGRLEERVHRIRAIGSVAISLSQVANTRADGMLTLWRTRAVDCAAAQLVVRESGGYVAFPGCGEKQSTTPSTTGHYFPLDLEPHAPVVAARTEQGLEDLIAVLG